MAKTTKKKKVNKDDSAAAKKPARMSRDAKITLIPVIGMKKGKNMFNKDPKITLADIPGFGYLGAKKKGGSK